MQSGGHAERGILFSMAASGHAGWHGFAESGMTSFACLVRC